MPDIALAPDEAYAAWEALARRVYINDDPNESDIAAMFKLRKSFVGTDLDLTEDEETDLRASFRTQAWQEDTSALPELPPELP